MGLQWRPRRMVPDPRRGGELTDNQPRWVETQTGRPAFRPYRYGAPRSRIGVLTRARVRLAAAESGEDEDG